ncbi:MAG: hypothetical protein PHO91_04470 [Patescibacteria group bacterium]|nr:hypothetical protein [Patescibacteria group bacterium]
MEVVSAPKANSNYSAYGAGARIYMNDNRFMCLAEEVGCQGYFPLNGDPMIPAVLTPQDLCPAQCVGYATFTEQVNIFDVIENPLANVRYFNFIPNTARACPFNEVGCEEFTNLEEVARGGEGREYYTYLRQCVPENLGRVYYTWEGSDVAGYQIRTWSILKSNLDNAPCTNIIPGTNTCVDNANNRALCGADTPSNPNDDPAVDPNCRQFFDTDGTVYYRFQDRVIFASNDCQEYRRTLTGQIYKAVPDLSITCSASNNNCRAYYGNAANNQRVLFSDDFEQNSHEPWMGTGMAISNESLNNEGQSLRILTNTDNLRNLTQDLAYLQFKNNREYRLSWWMKSDVFLSNFDAYFFGMDADGTEISVSLTAGDTSFENISAGNWRLYNASVYFENSDFDFDNMQGMILRVRANSATNNQGIYLDNVILKETVSSFAFVRNSWQTPAACDSPYTGYHLGCQAYRDTNRNTFNIKSFSSLCREQAIGCLPAIDTRNSTYPFAQTFNSGDNSEITVPEDRVVYLVPNPAHYCPPSLKGCQALGLPTRDDPSQFNTVYKLNDPDRYQTILCQEDALGCEEYNSSKGSYYFKDPSNNTCTYQHNVNLAGNVYSGWFITDSLASGNPVGCNDNNNGIVEPSDLEFSWDYCHVIGQPDNRVNYFTARDCQNNGHTWRVQETVALCPASKNLCTSFRDPSDPLGCDPAINNPAIAGYCSNSAYTTKISCENAGALWRSRCNDYYYYNNNKIDEASCNGLVDKNEGCILFYEANNWDAGHTQVAAFYDSGRTYDDVLLNNRAMSPVSCNPALDPGCNPDANRLLKVERDRQCAEWLSCKSFAAVMDENGQYQHICDKLDSCVAYSSVQGSYNSCRQWGSYDEEVFPLTFERYQQRSSGPQNHIQWSDKEYLGYSIPNYLPVKDLDIYNFGDQTDPLPRLAHAVSNNIVVETGRIYFDGCVDTGLNNLSDGTICSATIAGEDFAGACLNGICMVNPKAEVLSGSGLAMINQYLQSVFIPETRGYALDSAPFPQAIEYEGQRSVLYSQANICINGNDACEEKFLRVVFGRGAKTLYYGGSANPPAGICIAGDNNKVNNFSPCTENSQCNSNDRSDGQCGLRTEITVFRNWPGVCLEKDTNKQLARDSRDSYYCSQWYPAARIKGTGSIYDNYVQAGYYDVSGQDALFCAVAEAYQLPEDRYYCAKSIRINDATDYCTVIAKVPAGSLVHQSAMRFYSDVILFGYLDNNKLMAYGPDDAVSNGQSGTVSWNGRTINIGWNDSLGVSWLHREGATALFQGNWASNTHKNPLPISAGARGEEGSNLFVVTDFDPTGRLGLNLTSVLPSLNLSQMQSGDVFYAPVSQEIEFYYYSSVVDRFGNNHWQAGMVWPFTVASRLPRGMQVAYWHLGDGNCDSAECQQCPPGFHNIWDNAHLDGIPQPGNNRRGWDGSGNLEKDRYCAPMEHAIYILGNNRNISQEITYCEETYCGSSDGVLRGLDCLRQAETFYNNIIVPTDGCAGDPNCEYKQCMESTAFPADNGDVPWCSSFGNITSSNIEVRYRCRPSGGGFNFPFTHYEQYQNVTGISACLDRVYQTVVTSIPNTITVDGVNCEIMLPAPVTEYNRLVIRPGINSNLVQEISNSENTGCMDSNELRDCRTETIGGDFYDLSHGAERNRWGYLLGGRYTTFERGNPCQDLSCYQQCRLITQLDSEADLSWIRTDIWWRSQETNQRVTLPLWDSFYYSGAAYITGTDVVYNWPTAADTHFGAARGDVNEGLVVTRVPLNNNMGQLSAGTFFSTLALPGSPLQLIGSWNAANPRLANLFYRVYNLNWNGTNGQYEFYELLTTNLDGGNNRNTVAGPDYNPRALAVCGTELCPDNDGAYRLGFSINDRLSENIVGFGGSVFVSLKFFFHAHPDHMPVVSIDVDWGDGAPGTSSYDINPGKYKNNLPYCNKDSFMPGLESPPNESRQSFGGLSRACFEGYKTFYNNYQFDLTPAGAGNACNGQDGRPTIANASCFKPKVRIIDRWGWSSEFTYPDWIVVHAE